jgi:hypothetical protein
MIKRDNEFGPTASSTRLELASARWQQMYVILASSPARAVCGRARDASMLSKCDAVEARVFAQGGNGAGVAR